MSKSNRSFEKRGGHNKVNHENQKNPHDYSDFPYDTITPKEIRLQTIQVLQRRDELVDQSVSSEELTWDGVVAPIIETGHESCTFYAPIYLASKAHAKRKVRDAATKSLVAIEQHDNSIWHRADLYEKFKAYQETEEAQALEGERARYLRLKMQLFKLRGHGLGDDDRQKIHELKDELSEMEIRFSKNIGKDKTKIALGKTALKGVSMEFLSGLDKTKDGKYQISMQPADVYTVLQDAANRETRHKVNAAHASIAAKSNKPLLEKMVESRHEIARLLGHTSWAHCQLEYAIVNTPEGVMDFYSKLIAPLQPKGRTEIDEMTKQLHAEGYDDVLRLYDTMYYTSKRAGSIDLDEQLEILHHYPLKTVLNGIFEIAEEFSGLQYKRRKNIPTWHDDVLVYDVFENGAQVSTLYLDLFARDGKDEGTYHMPIRSGRELPNGEFLPSMGAIIAEFIPSQKGGLNQFLALEEIHELMHELGHFTAMVKARAEAAEFVVGDEEGLFLGKDYAELAAQVMEKWAEDPKILRRISGHTATGKKLSLKRIERTLEAGRVNQAISKLGRLALHYSDLLLHDGSHGTDFGAILRKNAEISMFPYEEDTFLFASWSHLTNYPAQTSGYDVSEAAAYDIFENFIKPGGLTNRETGREFDQKFLRPSGTKAPSELIKDLLGRDFTTAAYLRRLGVEAD